MRFVVGAVQSIERFTEEFVDAVQEAAENVGNFFIGAFKAVPNSEDEDVSDVSSTKKTC